MRVTEGMSEDDVVVVEQRWPMINKSKHNIRRNFSTDLLNLGNKLFSPVFRVVILTG